ncbi:AzlD domain-containing protein [Undibacterium jejuense]|uniref:AzlD domain-containing protein n=1 Tax=Undibacterium jejuense TaxID=1344949 RepID=A0A923HG19_9BURK|nr:AzlD domain-containing protein [Undibacterium jejuense]MBC3862360.1 AzlD domain-containing protein [Undibacterium jejuense]
MNFTLLILGMAIITVLIKAIFFILGDRLVFPAWLNLALSFVPVTVLTAIITPMILSPHGKDLELNLRNPQLLASLIAVLICLISRRQLLTIAVGLLSFFFFQWYFST